MPVSAEPAADGLSLEVALDSGRVRGVERDGVDQWLGIPFAAPPVGELRWRAPQPVAAWTGVRDAKDYASDCMQLPFPSDAAPLGTAPAEDCLYLNVWRPSSAKAAGGRLPVIVWIYGGGFLNGGASPPTYSGANVAGRGVVFVSFNYRLGRFGTFAHPALTRDQAGREPLGNYGMMDQIAALQWVQRHVAAFGGDPGNVTIVGESAGGMSVHALVTSPRTNGLFHKAVVMSGGDPLTPLPNADDPRAQLAQAEQTGARFGEAMGIRPDAPDALARLRRLSADRIVDGLNLMALFQPDAKPQPFSWPFPDGTVLANSAAVYAGPQLPRIPMMIGATDADIGGMTGSMVAGARATAARIADAGVPVWSYRFAYAAQSLNQPGAQHATDIPYFFDTVAVKYGEQTTPLDRAVGKTVADYLVNFVRSGDPNGPGLPEWPGYSARADRLMIFQADGKAVAQPDPWAKAIDAARAAPRP
ncbi:carboxylesterase/lipase family protein [Sphingomonas sp. CJ99]